MSGLIGKRMLSCLLIFSIVASLLPVNAVFAEGYAPYGDLPKELTINGQNFYDVYDGAKTGRRDTSNQLDFFTDVLTKHDLLANWAGISYGIFRSLPGKYLQSGTAKNFDQGFSGNSNSQFDLIDALVNKKSRQRTIYRGAYNRYMSSGLSVANSLKDVEGAAGKMLYDALSRDITAEDFTKHNPVDVLNDGTEQLVLYSMASGIDVHTIDSQYVNYYLFGMAFYDFKLSVLIDDKPYNAAYGDLPLDDAIDKQDTIPGFSYTYNSDPAKTKKSSLTNETAGEVSYTQTVGETDTVTVANTITNSATYTFTESVNVEAGLEVKLSPVVTGNTKINTGFSAAQAISTAYGAEKSLSETTSASYETAVPLKPHTAVDVISEGGSGTMITGYDCPVAISYKVAIFSMKGEVYDLSVGMNFFPVNVPQTTFQTVFGSEVDGSDAITNLYNRAVVGQVGNYDSVYGQTKLAEYGTGGEYKKTISTAINWDSVNNTPFISPIWKRLINVKTSVDNLTKARPMSVTGASMSQTMSYSSTVVKDMEALYPLKAVKPAGEELGYKLDVGDTVRVDTIKLNGLNDKNVDFYGFSTEHGAWSIIDADKQPLNNAVATLNTDPLSGQITLKATGPGSGYLTYTIEDDYYHYHGSETPISSKNVQAPYIAFSVNEPPKEPFTGTVVASGEITLTVGADPVNIGDIDTVDAAVYDSRGREIEAEIEWEAQELPSRGVAVESNMIRSTKEGTFHVRATYQDAVSDWIIVTSAPAPAEQEQTGLTRGDIVLFLHQLAGNEEIIGSAGFKDLDIDALGTGKYYNQAVAWALQNGVATGYSDEYFGVAEEITYEEFLTILYNLANNLGLNTDSEIAQEIYDKIEANGVSIWAREAVAWALTIGLITEADLAELKGEVKIDDAVDIVMSIADEGGLLSEDEPPEDGTPPEDAIEPEDGTPPEDEGASGDEGDAGGSAEDTGGSAEDTGSASEGGTE